MSQIHYQSYAPTPYTYTPLPPPTSSISLDEEATLSTTRAQRELHESLQELYAILRTLEFLEKAFIKDSIPASSYAPTCQRLLGQWKTILANETVNKEFGSLEAFKARYDVDLPHATRRLITGIPATVEHPDSSSPFPPQNSTPISSAPPGPSALAAAEATQHFITFMDALRLEYRAKDELHPLLANVITSVDAVTQGKEFSGRADIVKWLITLNGLGAGDEITELQSRQMVFDVEGAYGQFMKMLQ